MLFWTLVLYASIGSSVSITTAHYGLEKECHAVGRAAKSLDPSRISYVCVERP